jgi:spermidine synthase
VLSAVSALCALAPLARSSQSRSWWSQFVWSKKAALWLSASAIVTAVLVLSVPAVPPGVIAYGRSFLTLSPSSRILYVGEGMNSSIAISTWDSTLQFHVSGKVEASTGTFDMRLQRMLGHLPALIHPQARSVLVVGFGAGVTAGSFVEYPGLQRLTICEIEPLIPPVATRYFGKENHNVLADPRTKIVYDDARHYILTTPEKFDVITSDPIHPWVKGSATLYTREYFELVKKHLNPGGIVTQWVPLYETDLPTVKSELATFFDVFPDGSVWANEANGGGYDILLLGQASPAKIDLDEMQRRLDSPEYSLPSASLRDVGLGSAIDILATYAGQAPDLKTWLKGAAINRDGNLRLQYLAGLAANDARQQAIYEELLRHRRFPAGLIVGSDPQIQRLRGKFAPGNGLSD